MLIKMEILIEVNEDADPQIVERDAATAVAHYSQMAGHAGNATATILKVYPLKTLAGRS